MTALIQDGREAVAPDERLRVASVRPATSDRLGWLGIRAEHLAYPPDNEVDVPPTTHHWLSFSHGRASFFSLQFDGPERTGLPSPGSVTLIPAGCPSRWRWKDASESTHILVD